MSFFFLIRMETGHFGPVGFTLVWSPSPQRCWEYGVRWDPAGSWEHRHSVLRQVTDRKWKLLGLFLVALYTSLKTPLPHIHAHPVRICISIRINYICFVNISYRNQCHSINKWCNRQLFYNTGAYLSLLMFSLNIYILITGFDWQLVSIEVLHIQMNYKAIFIHSYLCVKKNSIWY